MSQLKGGASCAADSCTAEAGLSKLYGAQMISSQAPDARHGTINLVFPCWFQACFDLIIPCHDLIASFGNGNAYFVIICWKYVIFFQKQKLRVMRVSAS